MASLEEALGLEEEEATPTAQAGGTSLEAALGLEAEKPAPSLGRRVFTAAVEGVKDIGNLPETALRSGVSALRTIGGVMTGRPDLERLTGTAKGAAQAATLGAYQPELSETEADAALAGRTGASTAMGMGLSRAVTPLTTQLIEKLGPAVGKVAAKVIGKTAETGAYTTPAAIQAALTGDSPLEAGVRGMSAAGVGASVAGLSKMSGKVLAAPAKSGMDQEAVNTTLAAQAFRDWKFQVEQFKQLKQRNATALDAHKAALADAQVKLANGEVGAAEAYHRALLSHRTAEKQLTDIESNLSREAQKLRPKMTPEEAYAEYNALRETPEMLPQIKLTNTAATSQRLGGQLAQSTEGLPKAAGPGGMLEKLAVGLNETIGEAEGGPKYDPGMVKSFGNAWGQMKDADKLKANQLYTEALGISGDDLAQLSSGSLRLDQADRLLQLIGPNAGTSGLASRLYWSIMEDLRGSKDPIAKGLLQAKAVQRQDIAAGDVARMLRVVPDRFGRPTVSQAAIKNLDSAFRNYEKDPRLLKWDERVLVESVPAAERKALLETFTGLFKKREEVAQLKATAKASSPGVMRAEVVKPPKLEKEVFPEPSEAVFLKEQPTQWMSRSELQQLDSNIYFALRAAGVPLPKAVGLSRLIDLVPRWLFKAGMTSNGREFIKGLYKDGSLTLNDPTKIVALANYIQAADMQAQVEQQQQEASY